jgi:hypothetical protein
VDHASRSGKPSNFRGAADSLSARRALSVVALVVVAVATLLPGDTQRQMSTLIEGRPIGDELNNLLTLVVIGLTALAAIGGIWKSRLAKRLKMSWPLFAVCILYLLALGTLASSTVRVVVLRAISVTDTGILVRRVTNQFDAEHVVAYVALTILVALAWRQKIGLLWLALGVFAFGYVLELLQQLVPGREYGWDDLVANALGISLGVIGVGLLDLLFDASRLPGVGAHGERRRRRSGRSSRRLKRSALITALAGLLIAIASVLAGSLAELRLAQVGWQLFTQFSAVYAFTFWLGVLVMAVGGLMWRGSIGGRGRRVRTASPR